jgi:type II secretory pathway pseudopilin PulG
VAPRPGRRAADRAGYTIVELITALTVGSLLVGFVFQLLTRQTRFVELQSAREEVQQNTRAALELIGSELRTLPPGGTILAAATDSVTFRTARVWGVICAVTSSTSFDVAVPQVPGMSWGLNNGSGVMINLGTAAAPAWSTAVTLSGIGGPSTSCGSATLSGGLERRTLTLSAAPQNGAGSSVTPAAGSTLFLYDLVTYRTGVSSSVPGTWIQRRVGTASNQPMTGPVEAGGLQFLYFAGASTTPLTSPLSAADRASVTRVAVVVRSISRNSWGETRESKADTAVIALRNRL